MDAPLCSNQCIYRRVQEAQKQRKASNAAYGNQAAADYMNQLSKSKQTAIRSRADEERAARQEHERRMNPPQQGNI